jgi:FlgD Ig-like domain
VAPRSFTTFPPVMDKPLVRAAFAVLVLATVASFFFAQQLKSEFPLVIRFAAQPSAISPNADGYRDVSRVGFDLSERARVSFAILDGEGNEVRRIVDGRTLPGDIKHRFYWDARDSSGRPVPDGTYHMRLVRRDEGRVVNSLKDITVDRRAPRVRLESARPGVIATGRGERPRVRIRYRGPRNEHPEFRVFRTDDGPARVVLRFRGDDSRGATWNGNVRGRPAADGDYAFTVTVRDRAGNRSVAPREIPTAGSARAGTGVAVRRLTLTGPLGLVPAGALARLEVGPVDTSFRFALSRLGSTRALRKGRRIGGRLRVRLPRRARTGVYLVRVRARGRRAVWPLVVGGLPASRGALGRARPLVVLPALTWQGLNRVDDDRDGFADTLEAADSVRLDRPFADGRLPSGLRSRMAPLLRFLDRERLAYDLTTDLALARGEGPALGNAGGVAFAGSERWVPTALSRRMRRYVDRGGRVVVFGGDSFRRGARLTRSTLEDPTAARRETAFGEQISQTRTSRAPLVVEEDRIRLFKGLDRFVGDFTIFERSDGLAPRARLLASAGRDPDRPAFVVFRLGRGLVIRPGTPQWTSELSERRLAVEVPRVTARVWRLLPHGGPR